MKEIVLYEDEDWKKVARDSTKGLIALIEYSKDGDDLSVTEAFYIRKEDIKKIYHAIEEKG